MIETKRCEMKTDEILKLIDDKNFIDKIYQFSYRRCNTSYEAEDLCSDIIIAVISAVHKQEKINNFYAFVWTIARRIYADWSEKKKQNLQIVSIENSDFMLASKEDEIDNFIEETVQHERIQRIFLEIAFLSKAYREVMIMYYLDEIKVKDIASKLGIRETTVKQRLFSARNTVRKEVESMNNRNLSLKPIRLAMFGTGNPCGNDPRTKAERSFSQNLIYLCKEKPRTAKELSDELCVPMPYIEEELEIQCQGENCEYGMLRKLDNGKYAINVLVVDYSEYDEANTIFEKYLPEICKSLKESIEENNENILNFPYLSTQTDIGFILWSMISRVFWTFKEDIIKIIKEKYFSDVVSSNKPFSSVAIAFRDEAEGETPRFDFYGCDGIDATSIAGYRYAFVRNMYGKRIKEHFHCGHNFSHDSKLIMILKTIGGLHIEKLNDDEKEIAAKAIECGYIRKNGNILEPKIIVIDKKQETDFYSLSNRLHDNMGDIKERIAAELSAFMRKHIPEHLMCEYKVYSQLIAGIRILSCAIEECIKEGLLIEPESDLGAEGMLMVVEK